MKENRFNYYNVHMDSIQNSMEQDGYAIVENVLDAFTLEKIKRDIAPHLDITPTDNDCQFLGNKTKRFGCIVHLVPAAHPIIEHPMTIHACENILRKYANTFQLSFTSIMHVMAGESAQLLHRDVTPFMSPSPTVGIATMWAISDFKRSNGATIIVPGSHRWEHDRVPTKQEMMCAEMPAGSVLYYDTALIHGAGKSTEGFRTGLSLQYIVSWLRQEENQYLAVPLEYAKTLPYTFQELLGYDLAQRHWGSVGQEHPLDFLNDDKIVGTLEPPGYDPEGVVIGLKAVEQGIVKTVRFPISLDTDE